MIRCPSCSEEIPATARFCPHCGERLPQPAADGDIVAIKSTIIKAGTVTLGAEADGGECPICGRHNARTATFRCKGCNRPLICASHQDPQLLLCSDCVAERLRRLSSVTIASDGSGDLPTLTEAVLQCPPGATIHLQAGKFRLSVPLIIAKPLRLLGAGMDHTEIVCDAEGWLARFAGPGLFTAEEITFRHEGEERANVVEITGGSVAVNLCRFTGGTGGSVEMGRVGLLIRGDALGTVSNCVMEDNDTGILVVEHAQPKLESNTCRRSRFGIVYSGDSGGVARKNDCSDNEFFGIQVSGGCPTLEENTCQKNGTGIVITSDGVVRGNRCLRNRAGIWVNCGRPTLQANICSLNDQGLVYGPSSGGVARGNYCYENNEHGIVASSDSYAAIEGNTCYGNGGYGIRAAGAHTTVIENTCFNNANGDFYPTDLQA